LSAVLQLIFDGERNSLDEHGFAEAPPVTERPHGRDEGVERDVVFTPLVGEAEHSVGCVRIANGPLTAAFDTADTDGVQTSFIGRLLRTPPECAVAHSGDTATVHAFDVVLGHQEILPWAGEKVNVTT